MIEDRPLPATDDPLDAPYWQATLRGELVVQRCTTCNSWHVIIVELAEDPTLRIVGNLLPSAGAAINEIDPRTIEIGAPVRAVFDNVADDLALIRWVPARATEDA
jgi:uncharacterized OB-fold protein